MLNWTFLEVTEVTTRTQGTRTPIGTKRSWVPTLLLFGPTRVPKFCLCHRDTTESSRTENIWTVAHLRGLPVGLKPWMEKEGLWKKLSFHIGKMYWFLNAYYSLARKAETPNSQSHKQVVPSFHYPIDQLLVITLKSPHYPISFSWQSCRVDIFLKIVSFFRLENLEMDSEKLYNESKATQWERDPGLKSAFSGFICPLIYIQYLLETRHY